MLAPTVMEVDWDAVPNAINYTVYLNNTQGGGVLNAQSPANVSSTTVMFSQLTPGANYTVRIYATRSVAPLLVVEELQVQMPVPSE